MVGARVRRQQVAYARSRGLSDRRTCAVLSVARSTVGYQSRRAVRDAPVLAVIMVADSGWWHATALLVIALDHAFEAAG